MTGKSPTRVNRQTPCFIFEKTPIETSEKLTSCATSPFPHTMEAAGLAIGIVGLVNLFGVVRDGIQSWESFVLDSEILEVQWKGDMHRFSRWGRAVGLEKGQLSEHHYAQLDAETYKVIYDLLQVANIISEPDHHSPRAERVRTGLTDEKAVYGPGGRPAHKKWSSLTRQKMKWSLGGGKADRTEQVRVFEMIVRKLYEVVPIDHSDNKPPTYEVDVKKSDDPQGMFTARHSGCAKYKLRFSSR